MMDKQDLDRLAYAGAEIPPDLGYDDTLYFLMLRELYQFAKIVDMSPERGRMEKQKIEKAVRTYRADQRLAARQAETMLATGAARADYRKARDQISHILPQMGENMEMICTALSAADRIVEALDNIPIERA